MALNRETLIEEEVATDAQAEAIAVDSGLELIDDGQEAEPRTEVAGLLNKGGDAIADVVRRPVPAPKVEIGPPEDVLKPSRLKTDVVEPLVNIEGKNTIIRAITTDEIDALSKFSNVDVDFKVILPNLSKIAERAAKDPDNVEAATTDELHTLIAAIYKTYKEMPISNLDGPVKSRINSLKGVIKEAEAIEAVDIFLQLVNREPGARTFTPAESYAASRVVVSIAAEVVRLQKAYKVSGSQVDKAKYAQGIALQAFAQLSLTQLKSDAGFAFVANKIIVTPSKAYMENMKLMLEASGQDNRGMLGHNGGPTGIIDENNLNIFMESFGGEQNLDKILSFYEKLPSNRQKWAFGRSILSKSGAMFTEIYTSALLSNPLTHVWNAAGNTVMMELAVIEKFLAGDARQSLAMLTAQGKYFTQALKAGLYAARHERSMTGDLTSKFDSQSMNAVSAQGANLRRAADGGKGLESAGALFFDGLGTLMRMQGFRPMLAADEFFKALARGMEMENVAVGSQIEAYKSAIKNGLSKKEAKQVSLDAYLKTLHSPEAFDAGQEFAKVMTFQDDLPPVFDSVSGIMSHPITKIFVPFFKTPTQIMRRIGERSPLILPFDLVYKGMESELLKKGPKRTEMLTKVIFSTGVASTLMFAGKGGVSDDFTITGYGPTRKLERSRWLENHRPYSIGTRDEKGDWNWTSYERYDPVSGVLAMIADTSEALMYSDEDTSIKEMNVNLGLATMKYITTALPMTQFLGELLELAGSRFEEPGQKRDRVKELLSKQMTKAGLVVGQQLVTLGQGSNSLSGWTERYLNPGASNTLPADQYAENAFFQDQPIIRGFYQALGEHYARIPGLSSKLPPKVNRWYEEVYTGAYVMEDKSARGNRWQTFLPFKVLKRPKKDILNNELERLGVGLSMLSRTMNQPMIKLNGEQYNRYIELYNYPERSIYADKVFADVPAPISAYETYLELLTPGTDNHDSYLSVPAGKQVEGLRAIDSLYKGYAQKLLKLEYPELGALIEQRDEYKSYTGHNKNRLKKPSESEVDAVQMDINSMLDDM